MSKQPKAPPLTEADAALFRMRGSATQFWGEVVNVHGGTVEELAAALKGRKLLPHVLKKLLLDLVVDITPLDKPVPYTLIAMLRDALRLPKDHKVGSWPLIAGMHDDRGKPKHEVRLCAARIDLAYIWAKGTHMPLRMLQTKLRTELKLGKGQPDRKSLRKWRAMSAYWDDLWEPPAGGGK